MSEIITARKLLQDNHINEGFEIDDECTYDISEESMIKFATQHVKAALEIAAKDRYVVNSTAQRRIENAYNLDNIK